MEPLPGPRQLREVALELATRIAHVAVRYQLIDKALRVWGEKALGIPRDPPTSKRSTALYQPYGTDLPWGICTVEGTIAIPYLAPASAIAV